VKLLKSVRLGHAPNCSSAGSVVGTMLLTAAGASVVLNVWADRFLRWVGEGGGRVRSDGQVGLDGAVVEVSEHGAALLAGMPQVGDGPTEAHLAVTGRCPVACTDCYLSAGPEGDEVDLERLRGQLAELAELGVLEVAFGGGEALLRSEIVALCEEARRLGMTPNLTTSGFGVTPALAVQLAGLVGQVNVSLDGLGDVYVAARGWDGTDRALRAIRALREAGVRVGVNTVLTRAVWEREGALASLGAAIRDAGAQEWQWLRLKPTGRGADVYADLAPCLDGLWERLLVEEAQGIVMRVDCALVPWLAEAGLDPEVAGLLGVRGCVGGQDLWARGVDGTWAPCSFAAGEAVASLEAAWASGATNQAWRARAAAPPEPCASCTWQSLCRGGCRIVAGHVTGDSLAPDPECPRVRG